jgi:glyoxylate reductase
VAKILITKDIPEPAHQLLIKHGHDVHICKEVINKDNCISLLKSFDGCISMLSDPLDETSLSHLKDLKIISQFAVGYNNIDVAYCASHNIKVTNTPDVLTYATAELAMALTLSVSRKITPAIKNASQGAWKGWEPKGFLGKSLESCTVGIIGAGRIGQRYAKMCQGAFGAKIMYLSRTVKEEFEKQTGAIWSSLSEIMSEADVISLHCPLTEETKELINRDALTKAQRIPIIINTARGEIINQDDLIWALDENLIYGAGLDVTTPEPLGINHELFKRDNVVITPHIGSATQSAREDMARLCATNIINYFSNKALLTEVDCN